MIDRASTNSLTEKSKTPELNNNTLPVSIFRNKVGKTSQSKGNSLMQEHINNQKKFAFTLAEVLITLGIIGVVAAVTMPTLITKTRNKELQAQFLKTYSELNQIAQIFVAKNNISVAQYGAGEAPSSLSDAIFKYYKNSKSIGNAMGTYDEDDNFTPYYAMHNLNGASFSGGKNAMERDSSFLCDNSSFRNNMNGAIFILNDSPAENQNGPVVCVDINGKKGPNRYGIDYFMFVFTVDGKVIPMGQKHPNNISSSCTSASASCGNFSNIGAQFCSKDSNNITYNSSCAYYALINQHPTKEGKDYWHDFLSEVYGR